MTKLNDIQLILLSTASQRVDGSLLPLPASIGDQGDRADKALIALLKRGLAAETETTSKNATLREDGDLRIAAIITAAGREAIGVTSDEGNAEQAPAARADEPPTPQLVADRPAIVDHVAQLAPLNPASKQATIIQLLKRETGATLKDLEEETGWLPHTTRAALTGLRKKGHTITKDKVQGVTRYCMVASA